MPPPVADKYGGARLRTKYAAGLKLYHWKSSLSSYLEDDEAAVKESPSLKVGLSHVPVASNMLWSGEELLCGT